ncbi:hypothetical protein BCR35DRAFT_307416 [Leucosporidium creatinivorum]|uniref:SUI1 domain-containing protein n=1 Tax=Leucosporidium creatinivorum TaxID=106004 RepID=A0A1Y2EPX0_9BASI|nr:hypothetical protein BCR35DRAFT_307416 [Leucosporidium creatinivorum]
MFKRPHVSKTSAPLRSSDARKLREELQSAFVLSPALAKSLLPDGLLVQKATNHLEEPLTIYSAPNGDPRFFRPGKGNDGALIPTMYTFDLVPELLPVLVTAPQVVENLVSGAALFSAGVSTRSLRELPDSMLEGHLVAIRADGPIVAIGQLAADKKDLIATDGKGKAAITLHARGDYLWAAGSGVEASPLAEASPSKASKSSTGAEDDLSATLASTSISTEAASTSTPTADPSAELTPQDVDTLLRNALLLSISTILRKPSSSKLFPMPASSLYSTYILPYRPAGTPPSSDIKKSSFKKLAALMKQAVKAGVVTTKEVKGELLVLSVNGEHADVQGVRSYKTMAQAATQAAAAAAPEAAEGGAGSSSAGSSSSSVVVKELFKPSSSILPIFQAVEHTRPESDLYLPTELKSLLTTYIASQSLSHPRDQKFIKLDPLLGEILLKKGESVDVLTKEDANRRLRDGCTAWWSMEKKGEEKVVKKGSPPVIKVAIKNVGKRQVTLVSGHEPWTLFTSDELAEELKHRSASSTAVQPLAGSAKKGQQPKVEIMCQGTHDALVTKLLIARGVPKQYIDVDTSKSKR